MRNIIGIVIISSVLASCSFMQNNDGGKYAMCKELKRRMIFNAATADQVVATQERAEMGTLTRAYREHGC